MSGGEAACKQWDQLILKFFFEKPLHCVYIYGLVPAIKIV
jgi:hypothetical protein